ncbi:MAG: hypothetical protein N2512_02750 [Armatimonadetes bacterium]|nr:hypothetical protein [Armatimonadota bacterium]
MWSAAWATVVVLCLSAPAVARWPEGVLNYCGFEGYWDEAGWRDLGWMQGGTPGVTFDRQMKRYGKASLRIEGAPGETRAALHLSGVPVEPGKRYVLRAWMKTEAIEGEAALALQPHAEGRPLPFLDLGDASYLRGTNDWTLVVVPVPPLPAEAVRMYAYVWVKGLGTAWFDEFALTYEGVGVPLGGQKPITDEDYAGLRFDDAALPENLLTNPGFEDGLAGWYVEHGQPAIDDTAAASGHRSLRFDGFPECSYTVVQVHVRIDPRRAYRLSLKIKTDLQEGLSCVQLIPFKANGEGFGWWYSQDHTWEFCYGRGKQDWHEVSVVLREFQPETDFVNVYLLLQDAVGKVWFDDVRLTPLSLEQTRKVRGK